MLSVAPLISCSLRQSADQPICLQVKRAGPRPPDNTQVSKPAPTPTADHVPFGQGPRIYIGGVHESLSEVRLRDHFAKWGSISDIYFPGPRGQKRSNYCFITFENRQCAERACSESDRNLDGWVCRSVLYCPRCVSAACLPYSGSCLVHSHSMWTICRSGYRLFQALSLIMFCGNESRLSETVPLIMKVSLALL